MSRSVLFLLVLSYSLYMGTPTSSPTNFIKVSCKATRYPSLCIKSLVGFASEIRENEHHLALTALFVSLSRARSASAFVSKLREVRGIKPREFQAVKDCIENMGDSVDRLGQSIKELGHIRRSFGQDFVRHVSNVQTWVSAALTDQNTCLDGFSGPRMDGNVKDVIKHRVTDVSRVTSNALALVNHYASRSRHHIDESSEQNP